MREEKRQEKRFSLPLSTPTYISPSLFRCAVRTHLCIGELDACACDSSSSYICKASEEQSEWIRKAWLWLMRIVPGCCRWADHERSWRRQSNFLRTERRRKNTRNTSFFLLLLISLSQSNIARLKIVVSSVIVSAWRHGTIQPVGHSPTFRPVVTNSCWFSPSRSLSLSLARFRYLSTYRSLYNIDDLLIGFSTLNKDESAGANERDREQATFDNPSRPLRLILA